MKKESGITLIALVITIIVLLILAGISIAMLTGENGILSKATKAGAESTIAEQKEQVALAINALTAEYYDKKYVSEASTTTDSLEKYVVAGLQETDGENNVSKYAEVTPAADGESATIETLAENNEGKKAKAEYKKGVKFEWKYETTTTD